MTDDEAIREVMRLGYVKVRVQCPPAGHFIADITLSVRDGRIWTRLDHSKKDVRRRLFEKGGVLVADVAVSPTSNVELACRDRRCTYKLYRNGEKLALELIKKALDGGDPQHAVYRLTY